MREYFELDGQKLGPRGASRCRGRSRAIATLIGELALLCGCAGSCKPKLVDTGLVEVAQHLRYEGGPCLAAFDKKGDALVVADEYRSVDVWPTPFSDTSSFALWAAPKKDAGGPLGVTSLAMPAPHVVLTATNDGTVTLWDWKSHQPFFSQMFGRSGSERHATVSADLRFIGYAGRLFDRQANREVGAALPFDVDDVLEFSGNGRRLLVAGYHDRWMAVRESATGAIHKWASPDSATAGAIDATGDRIALAVTGGRIYLWNLPAEEPVASWRGSDRADVVRFSPHGDALYVGDRSGVSTYDLGTMTRVFRSTAEKLAITAIDGSMAAAASESGTVYVWDLNRKVLIGHHQFASTLTIRALAIEPSSHLLAVAANGGIEILRWTAAISP